MISDITGIDYSLFKDNIILETNESPINKNKEKFKRCDFIIKVDNNMILNLELNHQSHTGLIAKNLSYVFQLFATAFKKGDNYNDNLVVMQINLNCFNNSKEDKALSKYYLKEEETSSIYTKNLIIYTLNIVKCHELYYNMDKLKIPNYVRWGTLLYCNDVSKIPNITKGIMTYEERNIIMGTLDKLTKEDLFMTEEEAIHWEEWEKNTIYNDGKNDGIEQNIQETIKKMLNKNYSIKEIAEITNKTEQEIQKIKDQL